MMGRGQKPGQWHRTKTYSSLRTDYFELRAEKRGGSWIALVNVPVAGVGVDEQVLRWAPTPDGTTREEAERAAAQAARDLAAELLAAADAT